MGEKASTRRETQTPAGACFSCALLATRLLASRPVFLLVGGEEAGHVVCRDLVHVSCGVEVALGVVEGAVGDAFFGVCAVPGFAEVLCAAVDADGDGHLVVVADVFGEVSLLFVGEAVLRVGERVG